MKRTSFALLSLCSLVVSGCCWPGYWAPFGGCSNGQCSPQVYGTTPTGYQPGMTPMVEQTGPVAIQPLVPQQVAYPQPLVPTMAVESLPTYR